MKVFSVDIEHAPDGFMVGLPKGVNSWWYFALDKDLDSTYKSSVTVAYLIKLKYPQVNRLIKTMIKHIPTNKNQQYYIPLDLEIDIDDYAVLSKHQDFMNQLPEIKIMN